MDAASYAIRCRNGAKGLARVTSTVRSSTTRTPPISPVPPLMKAGAPAIFSNTQGRLPRAARSKENFTSAAPITRPLWNFTPGRSTKV